MLRAGAAILAVLTVSLWAGRLAAAPRSGVVVRVVAGAAVDEAAARRAFSGALGQEGVEVEALAAARRRHAGGAVARERLEGFARANELTQEGWRAYLRAEPGFAEARLVAARRVLEGVVDLPGAPAALAEVSLRLGAVRLASGRVADAAAAFALAARLDPGREPSASEWPPAVLQAYAKAQAGGGREGELSVKVAEDVEVEVDGALIGRGPQRLPVAVGEHVVVARQAGKLAAGAIVAVAESGGEVALRLDTDAAAALAGEVLGLGRGEQAASGEAREVRRFAEVDELWIAVVTWRAGEPALLAQRCGGEPLVCTAVREVRFARAEGVGKAAEQVVHALAEAELKWPVTVLADVRVSAPEPPGKPGRGPMAPVVLWRRPWLWIGVGVAAGMLGGSLWLMRGDEEPAVRITVPPL